MANAPARLVDHITATVPNADVDMHSALTTADLIDGVHPTATGYDKMAATWYNALHSVPGSIGDPTR